MMHPLKEKWFFILFFVVICCVTFGLKDWNSRFERPINGDAKGYYAYLPALFIYQDAQFSFIQEVEQNYYPSDRSHFKDFLNEQPNGRKVNKTFPGLSLLYAPFFFIAWVIAWLTGFACDGYSLPFQMSVVFAHCVYLTLGLWALYQSLLILGLRKRGATLLIMLTFLLTNVWYYTVYDHTVGHVFSFFLFANFCWLVLLFFKCEKPIYFSAALVVLSLILIIRPTNVVLLLFLPFLSRLVGVYLKSSLLAYVRHVTSQWVTFFVCTFIILLMPAFWYWQTGNFLVYSYGKEGFDFIHPHTLEFLFSYQKGWLLWSPGVLIILISTMWMLWKRDLKLLIYFLIPLFLIIYILSSWWCWTYGDGFGQRPMIEYLPLIMLAFGMCFSWMKPIQQRILSWTFLPFVFLSLFQGFQFHEGILRGGATTLNSYWSHFLQPYTDTPKVVIPANYTLEVQKRATALEVNAQNTYSSALKIPVKDLNLLKVKLNVAGTHKDTNVRLVVSSMDAKNYKSEFLGMYIYNFDRELEYSFPIENVAMDTLLVYVWNGDTESKLEIRSMEVFGYRKSIVREEQRISHE